MAPGRHGKLSIGRTCRAAAAFRADAGQAA